MKTRTIFGLVLVLAVLLFSAGQPAVQAQEDSGGAGVPVVKTYLDADVEAIKAESRGAVFTDVAVQGTAWVPELRVKFSAFSIRAWGAVAKAKAAGDQWVHIPIAYPTYIKSTGEKIVYVEFCAKSSAGANTKPVKMDLWGNDGRFYTGAVSWPADNAYHCWGVSFNPGTWKQSLGISVLLHFANTTDTITLYKGWASFNE